MNNLIKKLLSLTPYRVVRDRGANRFQAIPAALKQLARQNFNPNLIIDAGAHLGTFAHEAKKVFPTAQIHMIEPQPSCQPMLRRCAEAHGFHLHPFALAATEGQTVGLVTGGSPDTGAYISRDGDVASVSVKTTTLDTLFPDLSPAKRTLLKLDLQGYEIEALRGAERCLGTVEVILSEASFFSAGGNPGAMELLRFMQDRNFILFDIGSLSGRTRDNRLIEGDFVFVRRGSSLVSDDRYA